MSKNFVSIIWGYSEHMHGFSKEENYHLHMLEVAQKIGLHTHIILKGSKKNIEKDPNFDHKTNIIEYKNIFYFIYQLIKFSIKDSIFYVNSYEWQSFMVPFLVRKTIFMAHTQPQRKTKIKQTIQNFVYRFFKIIRLNNEDEKNFLIKQGIKKEKLFVIPLVVSNIFKDTNKEKRNLIYFGNITPTKNLKTILKALYIVKERYPEITLSIIGNVWDNDFDLLINEYNLESNIQIYGYIKQSDELVKVINEHLISLNSSYSEGQCVAVYDTALCGCVLCLPKIMSFIGVFKDKALFHDTEDSKQLAKNIIFYLNNNDIIKKYREKTINMIMDGYGAEVVEEKIINLLSNFK